MTAPGQLVRRIAARGGLRDAAWRAAFAQVPREVFVPYYYEPRPGGGHERLWRHDPDPGRRARWLAGVYSDRPLATRLRDGQLVSSSSRPSLMATMLERLRVADGMDVLEIGTGPGYNAALLCHRLGDAHVTTVDIDPDITGAARGHLAEAGYRPRVLTQDGALGCRAYAPYGRIVATCAVTAVPWEWPAQSVPGALIVVPLAGGLLALRVAADGAAEGTFCSSPACFVPLRGGGAPRGGTGEGPPDGTPRTGSGEGDDGDTDGAGAGAGDEGAAGLRLLLALTAGRVAPADAYALWGDAGRPGRERYGVSVRGGRQWAWLDDPYGRHTWPLAGRERG
ncbi:methyltransferase domain-containing protein [Streptomyces albus]|uniref:Protein-L-isoaspartate O-methyltransferase n=1 Tax=Streptomyces albus TaxID=1888 RepID=A0A8H1LCT1_9ACTN|nr:methyltransferase domain-containing protein [Streptomyces albus]TGG83462.1 methyltransferase domain-containing protein [Streptomyces albus]UVN56779.1 methyltransferase domain-containing protein [Streptomyces albus]